MSKVQQEQLERVIVVSPYIFSRGHQRSWNLPLKEHHKESQGELIGLITDAGGEVCDVFSQEIKKYTAATIIGKGKLAAILESVNEHEANTVVFDCPLEPSQQSTLAEYFTCKVIDRSSIIIDIFSKRAKSAEGKLQVELAFMEYNKTRLTGHGTSLSQQGAGIGTRGPGETKLQLDLRKINTRITYLKKRLKTLEKTRKLHRNRRKKNVYSQAALVGYTNAGKSTLLNALTRKKVFANDQLFATLDTTTSQIRLPSGNKAVLTDTVGFMQNLPHQLIKAFRATFEEITEADLWVHLVDVTDPFFDHKIQVVSETIAAMCTEPPHILLVFNKCDLLDEMDQGLLQKYIGKYGINEALFCSAEKRINLDLLLEKLDMVLKIPYPVQPEPNPWHPEPQEENRLKNKGSVWGK